MFDVSNLPFRDQFEAAVAVSGVCLAAAVLLREWFADREIRIMARILGAAGFAVIVTFAWRMTETNETLATQLMVKGKQDATSIADPVRVVAVASEFYQQCGNATFSITKYRDGRYGPVSVASGCFGSISDRSSAGISCLTSSSGIGGTENGSTGDMPTGEHGRRF